MPTDLPYQPKPGEHGTFIHELPGQVQIEVRARPTPGDIALLVAMALIVAVITFAVFSHVSAGGATGRWCCAVPFLVLLTLIATIGTLWRPGRRARHRLRLTAEVLTVDYQNQTRTDHYMFPRSSIAGFRRRPNQPGLDILLHNGEITTLTRFTPQAAELLTKHLNLALRTPPNPGEVLLQPLNRTATPKNPFPLYPP